MATVAGDCHDWVDASGSARQVTRDTKYGTVENIAAIEREGVCAYFLLSEVGHRAGLFRDTDFVYDAATDAYRCPSSAWPGPRSAMLCVAHATFRRGAAA